MGKGGALEAMIEAREQGLVRFLGVSGHGTKAPRMHLRSLGQFDFDTVLLPYNYPMMQNPKYAADFAALAKVCQERNVALQTIKSAARQPWGKRSKTYNTYFYEPLETQEAMDKAVHWVLGNPQTFLITAGDMRILPLVLKAGASFQQPPTEAEMKALVETADMQPIFS